MLEDVRCILLGGGEIARRWLGVGESSMMKSTQAFQQRLRNRDEGPGHEQKLRSRTQSGQVPRSI